MSYQISLDDQAVKITVQGHLYVEDAAELKGQLFEQIEAGHHNFVFDFAKLDYIDSAGLGLLISIQKRVVPLGGRVLALGAHGLVREIFELTKLDRIFFPR
ncbi:MAG: STAS domain-containing protein [Thermanaerothrix sp.]|nr:STAS domain-containing protein [Thermanaerothrix sp.]